MRRRDLLNTAIAAGALSILDSGSTESADQPSALVEMIDTNVSLFHWPFRRLPLDETEFLVNKLRALGITEAWAGSFEGLLHRDVASANDRLVQACEPYAELKPSGSINLELPGWEEDLRRGIEQHRMHAFRIHPNYHGYTLADARFRRFLSLASAAGKIVQIAVAMEDMRTQHPMMQVADVDLSPLPALIQEIPEAKVQLLNARLRGTLLEKLSKTPGLFYDTARVEGNDGVSNLVRSVPADRVMFGSHSPLLIPEAAMIRVGESQLNEEELQRVIYANANALSASSNRRG